MSKIILKRNTQISELKEKILNLQEKCGILYRECSETGNFNSLEHERLSKEIELTEYLLWGARNGVLN
jgi:hypothetical protein